MVHTNATNVLGGGPRDGGKQLNQCKVVGQNKTDWMNIFRLVAIVIVVFDVIIMRVVLVILEMAVV